jgi:CO/xanthine dehydrogenase Mo-binding subunit
MDIVADELGLDPIEVRLKNMIRPEDMPYENPGGIKYDSGDYPGLLKEAVRKFKYREKMVWVGREKSKGRLIGVGLTVYVEITGFGPLETATVRLLDDGNIEVVSGSAPHGQGDATAFAQIAASELGVSMDKVRVKWGDTELLPKGGYTAGSRTLTLGGSVVLIAARQLKDKILGYASRLLGVGRDKLSLVKGKVVGDGVEMSLAEIALRAKEEGSRLEAYSEYYTDEVTCPYGAYMAVVEVDEETGMARVLEIQGLDDLGRVVNPMLVEGQVYGGVLQSVGQALYENAVYSEEGLLLTTTLADYLIPAAPEIPLSIKHYTKEKPSLSRHPTGSKGVGEAPTIGSLPAIIRALENAIGARITSSHVSPENIKRLLASRRPG